MAMMSGIASTRRLDHRRAVHARQAQIGDDDVEGEFGQMAERSLARFCLLNAVTAILELLRDRLTQGRFVLDEEQMFQRIRHFAGAAKILTPVRHPVHRKGVRY